MYLVPITRMEPVKSLEEINNPSESGSVQGSSGKSFKDIFKEAIQNTENEVQKTQETDVQLAIGKLDDLHTAMIQAEQSTAAVEFTTQLMSKAVGAYNQIMGMQV
ncbi:flagellar hook-basal body complex protein FliE [Robinsoniella peoriensis]|uniref:flagellar hook-basal body complex protein FliE n=1 Tax=Robinsoniella peoriensis TaxID=180332 RepID=UPI00085BC41F|nr:flagellar hook-basal body complex protein FliE [Robinsoniella peoriensis]